MSTPDKKLITKFIEDPLSLAEVEVTHSLQKLCKYVHEYTHKLPIITLDEYDSGLSTNLSTEFDQEAERKLNFFEGFLLATFK